MKFTLVGLVVLLVVIIAASYVMNEEGFQTIAPSSPSTQIPPTAPTAGTPSAVAPVTAPTAPKATVAAAPNVMVPPSSDKVEVSPSGYDAMTKNQKASLLRDIQKVVRNELLSKRALERVNDQEDDYDDYEYDSDSTAQGRDYKKNSLKSEDSCSGDSKCDPLVDMTKYIRKDQIPCWGCNIDY